LEEIGYEVGFGNPAQFSRHFRKLCHQTPSQYRKRHWALPDRHRLCSPAARGED
jgi:AraC-like DNA-binding protein